MARLAHEIRNPLGAITNAAQLLGETVTTDNAEEKRQEQRRRHRKQQAEQGAGNDGEGDFLAGGDVGRRL